MTDGTEYDQLQKVTEALDIKKTSFLSMLDLNTVKIEDLSKIADLLGYEIKLEKK